MTTDRNLSALVTQQLPSFIREDFPKFNSFVKAYYAFMEENNQVNEVLGNIKDKRDIDKTTSDFIDFFFNEFMPNVPKDILSDKTLFLKHVKDLYTSKGSEQAYRLLFRIIFNEEIDFYYPSRDILRASDARWEISRTINVIPTTGNINDLLGKIIVGSSSGATGRVDTIIQEDILGITIKKLKLIDINGDFVAAETISDADQTITATVFSNIGSLDSVVISDTGIFHSLNDRVQISGIANKAVANAIVTKTTSDTGRVRFSLVDGGSGYRQANTQVNISGGDGSGATLSLTVTLDEVISIDNTLIAPFANVALDASPFSSDGNIGGAANPLLAAGNINSNLGDVLDISNVNTGSITAISTTSFGNNFVSVPQVSAVDEGVAGNQIEDAAGNIKGENAVIQAEFVPGGIANVSLTTKGDDFVLNETVTISNLTSNNLLIQNGIATAEIDPVKTSSGRYVDTRSFISGAAKLQDNFLYQEYSYIIQSPEFFDAYQTVVEKLVHPAGVALFGDYLANNQVSVAAESITNVEIISSDNGLLPNVLNINDLKEAPVQAMIDESNTVINVLGYYEPGDSGGGVFYFDSANTSTPDNGLIVQPKFFTGNGRWIRSVAENSAVNVRMFGAKGNGKFNDTQPFANAIAVSDSIYVPFGRWKVGGLKINRNGVTIEGAANTQITPANTTLTSNDSHIIKVSANNVTIRNLWFDGAPHTQVLVDNNMLNYRHFNNVHLNGHNAITFLDGSQNWSVSKSRFENFNGNMITSENANTASVIHNTFKGAVTGNPLTSNSHVMNFVSVGNTSTMNEVLVASNIIDDVQGKAVTFTYGSIRNVKVNDNIFNNVNLEAIDFTLNDQTSFANSSSGMIIVSDNNITVPKKFGNTSSASVITFNNRQDSTKRLDEVLIASNIISAENINNIHGSKLTKRAITLQGVTGSRVTKNAIENFKTGIRITQGSNNSITENISIDKNIATFVDRFLEIPEETSNTRQNLTVSHNVVKSTNNAVRIDSSFANVYIRSNDINNVVGVNPAIIVRDIDDLFVLRNKVESNSYSLFIENQVNDQIANTIISHNNFKSFNNNAIFVTSSGLSDGIIQNMTIRKNTLETLNDHVIKFNQSGEANSVVMDNFSTYPDSKRLITGRAPTIAAKNIKKSRFTEAPTIAASRGDIVFNAQPTSGTANTYLAYVATTAGDSGSSIWKGVYDIQGVYDAGTSYPKVVIDHAGHKNSGVPYYRVGGQSTTFQSIFGTSLDRTGLATMFNNSGNLVWNAHNVIRPFSNSSFWATFTAQSVRTDGQTDINGGTDFVKISDDGSTGTGFVALQSSSNVFPDAKITLDFVAKADGLQYVWGEIANISVTLPRTIFDLSGGTVTETGTGVTASMEDLGDGFWLCRMSKDISGADVTGNIKIGCAQNSTGNPLVDLDGTSSIIVGAVAIYRSDLGGMADVPSDERYNSALTKYIETDSERYLPRREAYFYDSGTLNFGGFLQEQAGTNLMESNPANWVSSVSNLTVSSNAGVSMTGSNDAVSLITTDTGAGTSHLAREVMTSKASSNIDYVFSIDLKDSAYPANTGYGFASAYIHGLSTSNRIELYLDLDGGATSNNVVGTGFTLYKVGVVDQGNGWKRLWAAIQSDASSSLGLQLYIAEALGDRTLDGDGVHGILAQHADVKEGRYLTSFMPSTSASMIRTADISSSQIASSDITFSSSAMWVAMRGQISFADTNQTTESRFFDWRVDSSNSLIVFLNTGGSLTGEIRSISRESGNALQSEAPTELVEGYNVDFNWAVRTLTTGGTDEIQIIDENGADSITSGTGGLPDLSSTDIDIGDFSFDGFIGTLMVGDGNPNATEMDGIL